MEKYTDYSVDDFLNDEFFLRWLTNPSQQENDFWNEFMKKYPNKKNEIKEAAQVFKLLHTREEKLGLTETYEILNRIQRVVKVSTPTEPIDWQKKSNGDFVILNKNRQN